MMLPICASFLERGLWNLGWAERGESQLKADLYKMREMLIHAHLNGFSPPWKQSFLSSSATVKFHFNVIKIKKKTLLAVEGKKPQMLITAVWGAFVMLLEKQRRRVLKGFQPQIRGNRMTGPEIKHSFTPWTGTRAAAAPSTLTPEGPCWNLPSPVMWNYILEKSRLER